MRAARIPPIAFWGFIASSVLLELVLFSQMQHMQHARDFVPTQSFLISTLVLYHTTFSVNSLNHLFGSRRYDTVDDSRNNWLLALITLGEGWHNNHHHYQSSANQGFFWWEIDISYYLIRFFSLIGLVWDVRRPSAKALRHDALEPKAERSHTPDGPGARLAGAL